MLTDHVFAVPLDHRRPDGEQIEVFAREVAAPALTGGAPWSVLGQSFGGFCTVTYLSFTPDGVREAFITGGLPGLSVTANDVYRRTYAAVAAKNAAHYDRYPGDVAQAALVARHLAGRDVRLPDGAPLSVQAFQSLGIMLGMSTWVTSEYEHDGLRVARGRAGPPDRHVPRQDLNVFCRPRRPPSPADRPP